MKSKIIGLITVMAIAIAGHNVSISKNNVKVSELAMVNIEALAANAEVSIPYICAGEAMACYDPYYHEIYSGYRW